MHTARPVVCLCIHLGSSSNQLLSNLNIALHPHQTSGMTSSNSYAALCGRAVIRRVQTGSCGMAQAARRGARGGGLWWVPDLRDGVMKRGPSPRILITDLCPSILQSQKPLYFHHIPPLDSGLELSAVSRDNDLQHRKRHVHVHAHAHAHIHTNKQTNTNKQREREGEGGRGSE